MNEPRIGILMLAISLWACQRGEGDDASLFGDGGVPASPQGSGDEGSTGQTGSGDSTGSADDTPTPPPPSPPPPPPPTPRGESSSSQGPDPSTDTGEGTTGEAAGSSGSSDTFNDGTLDVQVINQSMFPQGQCDDVIITNVSGMAVTWTVELPLPGTIDQIWNCEVMETEGMGTFTGVDFNATLDPGGQAMIGYCVIY